MVCRTYPIRVESHRPDSVVITHDDVEWYRILNAKVFFWPSEDRLQRMMRPTLPGR